jgi:hypothetical protein
VLLEVVYDHAFHDRVVLDNEDARRLIVGRARDQVSSAKCQGTVSAACVDIRDDTVFQMGGTVCFIIHRATSME